MYAVIFANGEFGQYENLKAAIRRADLIVCADGGARHAQALGVHPHVIIGDLDSASLALIEEMRSTGTRILAYPPGKDETDLELAMLYAKEQGATDITIFGAWGGRIDHALGNLSLLAHPLLVQATVRLACGKQEVILVRQRAIFDGAPGDLLSLLPMCGDVHGIVTTGLEYPLNDETLYFGPARGVSNVFLDQKPTVSVQSGILVAVHTRQEYSV